MTEQHEETDLQLLFSFVVANNVPLVEQWLRKETPSTDRRAIIRTELDLRGPIAYHMRSCAFVPHLLTFATTTLSAFHLAALLGNNDILVNFLDRDVPVDAHLKQSGGTALHFASLGGHVDTVKLLFDVYKADIKVTDKYGWTALHYASVQGRLPVVKLLVSSGIDVGVRDQDGTTAAYRASVAHHVDVLHFLCTLDGAEDLLRIDGDEDGSHMRGGNAGKPEMPKPQKKDKSAVAVTKSPKETRPRAVSDGTPPAVGVGRQIGRSMTLPVRMRAKNDRRSLDVRRIIQRELELAFESDYEQAVGFAGNGVKITCHELEDLRGIVRDELTRYKRDRNSVDGQRNSNNNDAKHEGEEEEDPYATLAEVSQLPPAPTPPELPPRNPCQESPDADDFETRIDKLQLTRCLEETETSEMLTEALVEVAAEVGHQWKQLSRALPIDISSARVEASIRAIEKRHPGDERRQAAVALAEWRINQRHEASTTALAAALRRCGMHMTAEIVEEIEDEYKA